MIEKPYSNLGGGTVIKQPPIGVLTTRWLFSCILGVQCLPIGCITSFGTFSCICGCGGCLGGGGNEED